MDSPLTWGAIVGRHRGARRVHHRATVATPSQELGRPSAMSAWVGSSPKEVTRGIGSTSPNRRRGRASALHLSAISCDCAGAHGRSRTLAFDTNPHTLRRALPAQHNAGHGRAPSLGRRSRRPHTRDRAKGARPAATQFVLLAEVLGCAALGCTTTATPEPEVSSQQASSRPPTSSGGGLIAFVSDREGVDALYLMRADGTDVRRLTEQLPLGIAPRLVGGRPTAGVQRRVDQNERYLPDLRRWVGTDAGHT